LDKTMSDGQNQNPSARLYIVPLSNFVPRGFGFVHHSIAILYHEVPNPNFTIRNFFIAEQEESVLSRKLRVETLPPFHTRLDMSSPAALSYNLMEWLKEREPPFTAVHVLSPFLAHFAALARQQGLALPRTPLVAHFLCDTRLAPALHPACGVQCHRVSQAQKSRIVNVGDFRVGDRSRARFVTPADFPPHSHVHVRRESLGVVPRCHFLGHFLSPNLLALRLATFPSL
jgi:hypothetical protein